MPSWPDSHSVERYANDHYASSLKAADPENGIYAIEPEPDPRIYSLLRCWISFLCKLSANNAGALSAQPLPLALCLLGGTVDDPSTERLRDSKAASVFPLRARSAGRIDATCPKTGMLGLMAPAAYRLA